MQQPALGKRLTALRKAKNLTQEELVEKSRVSVRTIQRIEAGEVMPRMYTVKILLAALGEEMETQQNNVPNVKRNTLLVAALAGAVFLVSETILGAMDIAWFTGERNWGFYGNSVYIALTVLMSSVIKFHFIIFVTAVTVTAVTKIQRLLVATNS